MHTVNHQDGAMWVASLISRWNTLPCAMYFCAIRQVPARLPLIVDARTRKEGPIWCMLPFYILFVVRCAKFLGLLSWRRFGMKQLTFLAILSIWLPFSFQTEVLEQVHILFRYVLNFTELTRFVFDFDSADRIHKVRSITCFVLCETQNEVKLSWPSTCAQANFIFEI